MQKMIHEYHVFCQPTIRKKKLEGIEINRYYIALLAAIDERYEYCESYFMSTLQDIEDAVVQLSGPDLGEFRAWFARFDAEMWDREFEDDARRGVLDRFADKALRDLDEGYCTKL